MKKAVSLRVNGEQRDVVVGTHHTLLHVLRYHLGLTGTKEGCGTGNCGACTVLMEGKAVNSCLVLAVEADGKEIITIEGMSQGGMLHPLQQAFIEHGALQCGFCTPGMLLTAKALIDSHPKLSEPEIRQAIAGVLCRCTGYDKIVRAIVAAAGAQGGEKK